MKSNHWFVLPDPGCKTIQNPWITCFFKTIIFYFLWWYVPPLNAWLIHFLWNWEFSRMLPETSFSFQWNVVVFFNPLYVQVTEKRLFSPVELLWSLVPLSQIYTLLPILWSPQDPRLCECNLWISLTYICLARVRNSFIIQDHPANIFSLIWMSGPTMALLLGTLGLWQSHSNLPSQKGPQGSGYPFYFCEDLPNPLGSWCSLELCLASLLSHWPFMGDFQAPEHHTQRPLSPTCHGWLRVQPMPFCFRLFEELVLAHRTEIRDCGKHCQRPSEKCAGLAPLHPTSMLPEGK